ncbi:MAG: hypothetical protein FWB99_01995 [Treponema sp.]|nr:hypothetical protein [Treponema sp.]
MNKFTFMIFAIFVSLHLLGCRTLEKETGMEIIPEFNNLRWSDFHSEIKEAHIHDEIVIMFETRNIPENEIVYVEIWEQTDNVLMDFIERLQGTVKNNAVQIQWTIGLDFNNEGANFNQEIERNRYTIVDLVFLVKHEDQIISSGLLAVLGLMNIQVLCGETREPRRNIDLVVISPVNERIYARTDGDGWARIRNLRRIGHYMVFANE